MEILDAKLISSSSMNEKTDEAIYQLCSRCFGINTNGYIFPWEIGCYQSRFPNYVSQIDLIDAALIKEGLTKEDHILITMLWDD
jgi:hypothetical protein